MNIELQPLGVLIGLAVTGIFTGVGLALGNLVTKYYLEPRIKKWRRKSKKFNKGIKKNILGGFKNE
jgi:hypothetical protein